MTTNPTSRTTMARMQAALSAVVIRPNMSIDAAKIDAHELALVQAVESARQLCAELLAWADGIAAVHDSSFTDVAKATSISKSRIGLLLSGAEPATPDEAMSVVRWLDALLSATYGDRVPDDLSELVDIPKHAARNGKGAS